MKDTAELFKILSDTTRLRMLQLLAEEELTVTELAQLLNMPQSRVSSQLQRIRAVFELCERRDGRKSYLSLSAESLEEPVFDIFRDDVKNSRQGKLDSDALAKLVARRNAEALPSQGQGSLGAQELPGRTWEGFARSLLTLIPVRRVLDVGVGAGDMTLLLGRFASQIHAVDPDRGKLSRLKAKADAAGLNALTCHEGQVESLPLSDGSVDLVVVSQLLHLISDAPKAIGECVRVLDEGGRLIVLDLLSHDEAWVKEKLGHQVLGFSVEQMKTMLRDEGLTSVDAYRVAKDRKPPRFVSILATGRKDKNN